MWCLRWTQSLAIIKHCCSFSSRLNVPYHAKFPFWLFPQQFVSQSCLWTPEEWLSSLQFLGQLRFTLHCLEFNTCFGPFGLKVQQTGFFAEGWKQWAKCTFFPLFNFNWRQQIKLQYYNITKIFLSPFYFSNETFHFQMLSVGSFPGGCVKPKSSFSEGNVSIRHARSPQAAGVLK